MKNRKLLTLLLAILAVACQPEEDPVLIKFEVRDLALSMNENPAQDQVIGKVVATPSSPKMTFHIKSQQPSNAMAIEEATGELTVASPTAFDYESNTEVSAIIEVTNGQQTEESEVTVILHNLEEEVPVNTRTWHQVKVQEPHFWPRSGHQAVVFNDEIWIIAGWNDSIEYATNPVLNDVWSSPDGINWTERKPVGEHFAARIEHQAVVFKEKIWVVGGLINKNEGQMDFWSSPDGIHWKKETVQGIDIPERWFHQMIVFRNKLWIIGGSNEIMVGSSYTGTSYNDIWSSPDGITWTKENVTAPIFSPRGYHKVLEFNNRLWLIGGKKEDVQFQDVWSSADGINWKKEVADNPDFSQNLIEGAWVNDSKMWVLTGNMEKPIVNELWSSTDGINWKKEFNAGKAPFPARFSPQTIPFKEDIWLIGGSDSRNDLNDVWRYGN